MISMGRFDDIIERGGRRSFSDEKTEPAGEPINILEMLESPDSPLASVLQNLNPDMKSKVIIPLAGLLDKYGLGEGLASSPTATGAASLMSIVGDIAPVIKGLADFVSGQKNGLAAEDKKFLQEIMEADSSSEFSDLFSDIGEPVEATPVEPVKNVHPLLGELPNIDLSNGDIDWMQVLDPTGSQVKKNEQAGLNLDAYAELIPANNPMKSEPRISMPSLEELAAEANIGLEELKKQDSNIRPETEIEEVKEQVVDELVDSIIDNDTMDEIYYLDDAEYAELAEQGFELEALNDEEE